MPLFPCSKTAASTFTFTLVLGGAIHGLAGAAMGVSDLGFFFECNIFSLDEYFHVPKRVVHNENIDSQWALKNFFVNCLSRSTPNCP
jgi:hypothetical protein